MNSALRYNAAHSPPTPVNPPSTSIPRFWFLFAHGAGAGSTSAWMQRYRALLMEIAPVVSFDYAYMAQGKKRPDPLTQLIAQHEHALHEAAQRHGDQVVLIGKSMGGRIGCHLALRQRVLGVICLGYPLVGQGKSAPLRDQVLLELTAPALFIQGTRDPLCPLSMLETVLARRTALTELHVVESGDHSLSPTKAHLKQAQVTETELERQTMSVIARFCQQLSG